MKTMNPHLPFYWEKRFAYLPTTEGVVRYFVSIGKSKVFEGLRYRESLPLEGGLGDSKTMPVLYTLSTVSAPRMRYAVLCHVANFTLYTFFVIIVLCTFSVYLVYTVSDAAMTASTIVVVTVENMKNGPPW